MILALRLHERMKIPSWFFYMFIGNVMEAIEKMLTSLPCNIIVSLVTPDGIEASMLSLTSTVFSICSLNKGLMGIFINKVWVHANNSNLEDTLW